ncbi:hypothetical protein [Bacillus sp. PS06]|uniref:hypothetical protein n=1 Tax=Bacillus sp. PS06 TaxID=2764176 RepID=UPI00177F1305|nr:hypothetical protein [Bacillus sp. PS06]MBD8068393.1 hypothetical protein [Bacillus sp. PS06]
MLSYQDLKTLFKEYRGTPDNIEFHELYIDPTKKVNRGLFVPLSQDPTADLKQALYNGAIGSLWKKEIELPSFLPNHFPLFIVEEQVDAIKQVITLVKKNKGINEQTMETRISLTFGNTHIEEGNTFEQEIMKEIKALQALYQEEATNNKQGGERHE